MHMIVQPADLGPGVLYAILIQPHRKILFTNTFPVVAQTVAEARALRTTAEMCREASDDIRRRSQELKAAARQHVEAQDKARVGSMAPFVQQLV